MKQGQCHFLTGKVNIVLTFKKGERIEVSGVDATELVLVSPNGTKYKLKNTNHKPYNRALGIMSTLW